MRSPSRTKEVQKAIDKCLPFFDSLKGNKRFLWDDKCEQAFRALKEYLGKSLLLSKPIEGEPIFHSLAVSEYAISGALVREEEKV